MEPDGFALLLSASHTVSLHGLSRFFEGSPDDLGRRISGLPIILVRSLPLREAHRLSNELGRHGVSVVILPVEACGRYPQADLTLRPAPDQAKPAPTGRC